MGTCWLSPGTGLLLVFSVACCGGTSPPAPAITATPLRTLEPRAAFDVDGDGHADIAVPALGSQGAGIYLGSATPRLATFVLGRGLEGTLGRDAIGVGDLDHNGWRDIAEADALYGRVVVHLVGSAGVGDPIVLSIPRDGAAIARVSVAGAGDVNEDGFDDLVVGSNNAIYLYAGSASGLGAPTRLVGAEGYGASVAGGGDIDGDGHVDVVVGADEGHAIFVHLGDGRTLRPATRLDHGGQQMGDEVVMAGDVNHDGFADVLSSGYGGNGGWIFYGSRAGLGPATSLGASAPAGWSLFVSAAGDVDGDGFDDVVSGGYADDGAFLYRGSASGLIAEPQRLPPLHPDEPWMYRVRGVGDVNGDGFADVVVDNDMPPRFLYWGRSTGLAPGPVRLDSRPDPSAPPPFVPPPPVTFPPAETSCSVDADCELVPKRDDGCCPLCAQYVAATHAWARRVEALCTNRGMCAISCMEGAPPTVRCDAGHCALH